MRTKKYIKVTKENLPTILDHINKMINRFGNNFQSTHYYPLSIKCNKIMHNNGIKGADWTDNKLLEIEYSRTAHFYNVRFEYDTNYHIKGFTFIRVTSSINSQSFIIEPGSKIKFHRDYIEIIANKLLTNDNNIHMIKFIN